RFPSNYFKILAVYVGVAHHREPKLNEFAVIFAGDARDYVPAQAANSLPLLRGKLDGRKRLLEIIGNAADRVMRIGQPIEREIKINVQLRAACQYLSNDCLELLRQ